MWLYNESSEKNTASKGNICNTCIVFVVGGVTFEEAKEVSMISNQLIQPALSNQDKLNQMAESALGNQGLIKTNNS